MDLERLYTIEDVAGRYGCGIITIRRWVRAGRIRAINLSGTRKGPLRFRMEDLAEFEQKAVTGNREEKGKNT